MEIVPCWYSTLIYIFVEKNNINIYIYVMGFTMLRLKDELGGKRRTKAGFDGEEEIRWNRHTRDHVFENKSLVFKFLPLRCSERVPI